MSSKMNRRSFLTTTAVVGAAGLVGGQLLTACTGGKKEAKVTPLREAGSYYLRVYIDKAGGVSINDCEAVSRALDALLDEADPIPDSYIFEVASAGAERELKRPSDFEAFIGSEVEVRTYRPVNGQKSFIGILKQYQDGDLVISSGDQDTEFKKQDVALVRLHVSF